jgi:hypothetical protein
MNRLALCLLLLALPDVAHGQLLRLTPDAASDIRLIAETARAEANDGAERAARAFREAYRAKFPNRFGYDLKRNLQVAMVTCVFSPTQWYVRQLIDALLHKGNLSSIEVRDALVVVFAPNDPKASAPKTLWMQQVEAGHAGEIETRTSAKASTPFLTEQKLMEFEDLLGTRVQLPARVFHFNAREIDMTKVTDLTGTADNGQTHTFLGISAAVMKSIR